MVLPASFSTDNQAALNGLLNWCADRCRLPRAPSCTQAAVARAAGFAAARGVADASVHRSRRARAAHPRSGAGHGAHAAVRAGTGRGVAAGDRRRGERPLHAIGGLGVGPERAGPSGAVQRHALLGGVHRGSAAPAAGPANRTVRSSAAPSRACTSRCAPTGRAAEVDPAFYTTPTAPAATWLLSGGDDPATPPRHGERTARALGAKARHTVVPHAGHGVMALGVPARRGAALHRRAERRRGAEGGRRLRGGGAAAARVRAAGQRVGAAMIEVDARAQALRRRTRPQGARSSRPCAG